MAETDPYSLVQGTEELDHLAEKLKKDLPFSSYVYNGVLIHTKKFADTYSYYVLKEAPESHIVLWKNKENQMAVGIHCKEDELALLEKTLNETKIIDFSKSICIFHVPDYLLQLLQDIAEKTVGQEMSKNVADDFIFDASQAIQPLVCPVGFRVYRLGKAGVQQMHNNWRYKIAVPLEEVENLTKHVACAGIYEDPEQKESYSVDLANIPVADDEKVPLSWIAACMHGPQGMQMTDEAYRRRGFASLLSQICAKMMIQQGFYPHASVEEDLVILKKMYEKLPGWRFSRRLTWVWQMVDEHGKVKKCTGM